MSNGDSNTAALVLMSTDFQVGLEVHGSPRVKDTTLMNKTTPAGTARLSVEVVLCFGQVRLDQFM